MITEELIETAANRHTDLEYPMGVERAYPISDFTAGALWAIEQLTQSKELPLIYNGEEIKPAADGK